MNSIAKLFRIDAENHELMGAQLAAFSRQVPLLYFILSVNSIALAFTHLGIAPPSLTVAFPGFLVGAEIAAGVPVLRAVGAKDGEMLLALKSGNFGGPEFFSDALKLMR